MDLLENTLLLKERTTLEKFLILHCMNPWQTRAQHVGSSWLRAESHKSGTRLSRHCGRLEADNIPYTLSWSILCETKVAFNPTTGFCKLCVMEKYYIMFKPGDASLNLRSEFFSHCRHKVRHLLRKS